MTPDRRGGGSVALAGAESAEVDGRAAALALHPFGKEAGAENGIPEQLEGEGVGVGTAVGVGRPEGVEEGFEVDQDGVLAVSYHVAEMAVGGFEEIREAEQRAGALVETPAGGGIGVGRGDDEFRPAVGIAFEHAR